MEFFYVNSEDNWGGDNVRGQVLRAETSDKYQFRLPCGYKIDIPNFRETLEKQCNESCMFVNDCVQGTRENTTIMCLFT